MAKIGYARVSTQEQSLDLQIDELKKEGCQKIFHDTISGVKSERPGLEETFQYLRPGDTLVVWKLDRLGRSLKHLMDVMQDLKKEKIYFKSLQESVDTSSSSGQLIFHIFGAIAEFEKDLIRQRTQAGLKAAMDRGKLGGRKKKLTDQQLKTAKLMIQEQKASMKDLCQTFNVSRATMYRSLKKYSS